MAERLWFLLESRARPDNSYNAEVEYEIFGLDGIIRRDGRVFGLERAGRRRLWELPALWLRGHEGLSHRASHHEGAQGGILVQMRRYLRTWEEPMRRDGMRDGLQRLHDQSEGL
jgi:hypothetical protein